MDRTRAAEALFCSTIEPSDRAAAVDVMRAVDRILSRYGAGAVCGQVAQLYGDDPDAAAARMRWCLSVVAGLTKQGDTRFGADPYRSPARFCSPLQAEPRVEA